jgi:zinc protease
MSARRAVERQGGRAVQRYGGRTVLALLVLTALPPYRLTAQTAGRIDYSTYTLPNGLRVVLAPKRTTPIVTVNVWYDVGSASERIRRSGFAHLFEHMMFQGSAHVAKAEHFQLVQRAGGSMNGSTNNDRTNYFETLPSNRLNLGLWLEADRMRSLAITPENLENQRQAVKEERRLRIDNQPYAGAIQTAFTMPFDSAGCFAYAHTVIGDMADLDSARLEDVQAFFNAYYTPSNAVLTIAGDFDEAEARRLVEQYFGDIPSRAPQPESTCQVQLNTGARRMEVTDQNANLPAVAFVYKLPAQNDPDAPALDLLSTILGGGESSRLNRRIVRQERAALFSGAFAQLLRTAGVSLYFAVANQGVPAARIDSMLAQEVDRLRSDSVMTEELEKAKNQYRTGAIRSRQTTMGIAETLQGALRFNGDLEAANREMDKYMAVTVADIRRVAQRYLAPENRLTLIINPPNAGGAQPAGVTP